MNKVFKNTKKKRLRPKKAAYFDQMLAGRGLAWLRCFRADAGPKERRLQREARGRPVWWLLEKMNREFQISVHVHYFI